MSKFSIIIFDFVTDIYRPGVTLLVSPGWEIDPEWELPNPNLKRAKLPGDSTEEPNFISEEFAFQHLDGLSP